jgi:Flp pilus assembly protein CpaB
MKRVVALIAVALVLGLLGHWGYRAAYGNAVQAARRGWDVEPVIGLAVDVDAGTPLSVGMIAQQELPDQVASANVVRPDGGSAIGRRPLIDLKKGDPLLWSELAK